MTMYWRVILVWNWAGALILRDPCPAPQLIPGIGHCATGLGEDSARKPGIQRDVSPPSKEQYGLPHQMALINQECSNLKG